MRVRGGWKGVQEQSILGGLIFRTQRRAHDLQVIGKVSSRIDVRIYLVSEVTGMSSLRNDNPSNTIVGRRRVGGVLGEGWASMVRGDIPHSLCGDTSAKDSGRCVIIR